MTLSYLSQFQECVLDGAGNGVCTFRPDTGQFWLPNAVRIGTRNNNCQAGLHYGAINLIDDTTLWDYTFTGTNDTSTILSGVVVSPGTAITVHFVAGTAADIGFAEISGVSSDAPPTVGIIPAIPGARFAGSSMVIGQALGTIVPNALPKSFSTGALATNATSVLLAAVVGTTYRIFNIFVNAPGAQPTFSLQTTGGTDLGIYTVAQLGAPAAVFVPPLPPMDWHGAPITKSQGLQLKNLSASTIAYQGHVIYGT